MAESNTSSDMDEYATFRQAAGIFTPLPGASEGDQCITDEDCIEGYVCVEDACVPEEEKHKI
jgi:hypothetical protein